MSTAQRNDACLIAVDPSLGEILRRQTLVVLESNHEYFEDLLDFSPQAQYAMSVIYRDAFAVLDALGVRSRRKASQYIARSRRVAQRCGLGARALRHWSPSLVVAT